MDKEAPRWVKEMQNSVLCNTGHRITPMGVYLIIYEYEMMKKREKVLDELTELSQWEGMYD